MNNVSNIKAQPYLNVVPHNKNLSFCSGKASNSSNSYDAFIKEREEAKKNAKKQQKLSNILSFSILGVLALSTGIMLKQAGLFKRFTLDYKDLANEKTLEEMALPENLERMVRKVVKRINNYDEIIKKGGKKGLGVLLYGPPGTGKNTFAYAIAKKFPKAKFVDLDVSKMNSKWHGESEQNILGTIKAVLKEAKKHPDQKFFVFIDEIDSVMMLDKSSGAKLSNDILNAFKKGFNQLTNRENIIVIGATNLKIDPKLAKIDGKELDTAMLDRFARKLLVDLTTKEQIKTAIKKYYQNENRTMVDSTIKEMSNPKFDKLAEFLADKERGVSFRKLTDILADAAEIAKEGENLKFDDIIQALIDHQNNLNISDIDLNKFIKTIM